MRNAVIRRVCLAAATCLLSSFVVLGWLLPAAHNAVSYWKADLVAKCVAEDLCSARHLAQLRSCKQTVEFDVDKDRYVVPNLSDGAVTRTCLSLKEWPYCASVVAADFNGHPTVTFNGWGIASEAGEVVIDVGGHRRHVRLEPTLGRISISSTLKGR